MDNKGEQDAILKVKFHSKIQESFNLSQNASIFETIKNEQVR